MKTWNNPTKAKFLDMAMFREEFNLFEQGQWLDDNKEKDGVFCGCMHGSLTQLDEDVMEESAKAMKWPLWLSYLSEKIFEGLPSEDAVKFPAQLIAAVPANITHEKLEDARALVEIDRLERLKAIQLASDYSAKDEIIKVLDTCIDLWKDHSNVTDEQWSAAWSAAESAAESAERSAAESSAWSSAWSSARSAAWSAAARAESAATSAAARAAVWSSARALAESEARSAAWSSESSESAYYQNERDSLIKALSIVGGLK